MRAARKTFLFPLLLALLLIGGLLALFIGREPRYAGKGLSQWVAEYVETQGKAIQDPSPDPSEAISHIGAKAIPFLLKWIRYQTPTWKKRVYDAANPVIERIKPSWSLNDQKKSLRAEGAKEAFGLLGPEARGAVRELGRLATDPRASRATAEAAVTALGYVGKDALPALKAVLRSQQQGSVRVSTAKRIQDMGTNALPAAPLLIQCVTDDEESVAVIASDMLSTLPLDASVTVPAWIKCLQDGRPNVRRRAMLHLGHLGKRAGPAIPSLVRALLDDDSLMRASATNALHHINPEVLENLNSQ